MKTKRLLLAWFLACLLPLAAQAEEWTDFTFTYEYKPGSGVAKVKTCNDYRYDHGYTVEIKIPSTISIDRSNYVVTEIGERAFSKCVMISQVDLPKTLTTIGSEAFAYCSKLSKIICNGQNGFPEGLTTIESGAFYYCTSLTNITIPNSITILGGEDVYYGCFDSCTNLQSVTLQDGLTEIGEKTFAGCTNLTSINIPSSVKRIGMSCFMGCTSLHDVTLQEGLDVIESSAFERCTSLVSITIPSTVTSLEGYHIYEDGSASFKAGCFEKCTSLDNVTLKEGLTTIGMDAFKDCSSLTNISIPSTVKDIEYNAFMGCTNLSEVKSFIKDPFGLYYNQFPEEAYSGTLYVPEGTKKEYASTPGWANFKNIEELETDIEGYYVISSAEKWKAFAAKAEEMPNLNARLTADINLGDDQTMIGVNVPYQGTFDGQGHTLKVNLSNSQSACAPFRNISNATIKNLHVTGTIDGGIYSAGLVASTDGTCSIENCRVSANITCTGDEYNGACGSGFVGNGMSAALAIKGCLFEGIIKNVDSGNDNRMSSRATPFIGSGNAEGTTVKDCMEKGTYVDFMLTGISFGIFEKYVINTYNSHGWYYHYRSWISYGPARSITSGQPNLVLDFGTPTTVYDVSGITAYKTGIDESTPKTHLFGVSNGRA